MHTFLRHLLNLESINDIVVVVILRVVIVVVADVGRSFEDEKKAKMGIVECVKHSLIEPFSVLYEREGICCSWLPTISLLPFKTT